jgi:ABC-type multidrug transport system ATPase subunit
VTFDFDHLTLSEVSHNFGRRRALARVSLTARTGEIVGLMGPNGAGKSTLLAVASTLLTPSSGEVRYGAVSAREAGAALRARIGLVAHEPQLYPELTARENLRFFCELHGLRHADRQIAEALAHADLGDRADDRVATFSRGLKQRLALERALLHGPRLVLLDEPFTGLDDRSSRALVQRLSGLRRRALIIVATHDFEAADALLDRACVLREGRAVALEGAAGRWRERYQAVIGVTVAGQDLP